MPKRTARKGRTKKETLKARSELASTFAAMLRPNPMSTISDFVDGHLYIPPPAQFAGMYRLDLTPYAKDMMDECSPSSPAREIIMVTGTQMSKTQIKIGRAHV